MKLKALIVFFLMAGFYEKTGFTTSGDGDLMMKILD